MNKKLILVIILTFINFVLFAQSIQTKKVLDEINASLSKTQEKIDEAKKAVSSINDEIAQLKKELNELPDDGSAKEKKEEIEAKIATLTMSEQLTNAVLNIIQDSSKQALEGSKIIAQRTLSD